MKITAPTLSADAVERVIHDSIPHVAANGVTVESVGTGTARVRFPYQPWMLRPGNVLSGPALFLAADVAMFAVLLAHAGKDLKAVTSDLTMHFLNKAEIGDITAEAKLLKVGRRLAVMEVSLFTAGDPTLVAHVTGSYVLLG
jgi:uncharacterized protein (TIGR00369 family)